MRTRIRRMRQTWRTRWIRRIQWIWKIQRTRRILLIRQIQWVWWIRRIQGIRRIASAIFERFLSFIYYLFIYLFLIYLKLTTQAVHIYTNKIAILLKIDSMLINVSWKIIKNNQIKKSYCLMKKNNSGTKGLKIKVCLMVKNIRSRAV